MPSQLSWLTLLFGAFFVFIPSVSAIARPEAITFAQLAAALDSTSPVLAEARTSLAHKHAAWTSSRTFPNPQLFGEQETLHDAENSTERTLGARQNLGFLWSYSSRKAAALAEYESAEASYSELRNTLAARVLELTVELARLQQQGTLMDSVLLRVSQLAEATTERRRVGDLAPYDEQRFLLEQLQLQSRKQELTREAATVLRELVETTGLPAAELENLDLSSAPGIVFATEDEAVRFALAERPELLRTNKTVAAGRHTLTAARRSQLPDLSLGAGHKLLDPGPQGFVIEAELEIPLFQQRRSERRVAQAELREAELLRQSAQVRVEAEVRAAYRQLRLAEQLQPPDDVNLADSANVNLLRGVRLYLEGEISAFELVDAMRTSIEAQDAVLVLRNSVSLARGELRRAVGLNPLEEQ